MTTDSRVPVIIAVTKDFIESAARVVPRGSTLVKSVESARKAFETTFRKAVDDFQRNRNYEHLKMAAASTIGPVVAWYGRIPEGAKKKADFIKALNSGKPPEAPTTVVPSQNVIFPTPPVVTPIPPPSIRPSPKKRNDGAVVGWVLGGLGIGALSYAIGRKSR